MKTILFVCTGNTCRSPMAQALTEEKLKAAGDDRFCAASAGLFAEGGPAAKNAVDEMARRGLDLTKHRSTQLTVDMLRNAVRVYTMSAETAERLKALAPAFRDKIFPLPGSPIPDPYGGDPETYRRCADRLEESVAALLKERDAWN